MHISNINANICGQVILDKVTKAVPGGRKLFSVYDIKIMIFIIEKYIIP